MANREQDRRAEQIAAPKPQEVSSTELLKRAGLERGIGPNKVAPGDYDYFNRSLTKLIPSWTKQGKDPELEAARWLEKKLTMQVNYLETHDASANEITRARKNLAAVQKARATLEPGAEKREGSRQKPVDPIEQIISDVRNAPQGVGQGQEEKREEGKRAAILKANEKTPEEFAADVRAFRQSKGGVLDFGLVTPQYLAEVEKEATKGQERPAAPRAEQQVARRIEPERKEKPEVKVKIPQMDYVLADIMSISEARYGPVIVDQNESYPGNMKSPEDFIRDAMKIATAGVDSHGEPNVVDIGEHTSTYDRAVNAYALKLNGYAKNPRLGSNPQARMLAGLRAEDKAAEAKVAREMAEQEAQTRKAKEQEGKTYVYNLDIPSLALGNEPDKDKYGFSLSNGQSYRLVSSTPLKSWEVNEAIRSADPVGELAKLGVTAVQDNHNPNQKPEEVYASVKRAYDNPDPLAGIPELAEQKPGQPKPKPKRV